MSNTLYRKYRPKNFSEVIGQAHIVRTLGNSIRNGRIGHAYLFTGPRGTGKTSIARIFAKAVNCAASASDEGADAEASIRRSEAKADACLECKSCKSIADGQSLDIIEIDAASNTGVDNIRELRETVSLPPTSLRYKVYIIDEVHMLSGGAFNALLKTLEEPPSHVIFILATTEIHKVPETIISRCQRFDFTRLPIDDIIEKLSAISTKEGVTIEKEALEMIAISAEGGMRDAESLLGQIISLEDKNVTAKEVKEILGTTDREFVSMIARKLIENDTTGAIADLNKMVADGYDLTTFAKSLLTYMRELMLLLVDESLGQGLKRKMTSEQLEIMIKVAQKSELPKIIEIINLILEAQGKISAFLIPQLALEIAFIKATRTFPAPAREEKKEYKTQETKKEKTDNIIKEPSPAYDSKSAKSKESVKETENEIAADFADSGTAPDIDDVRNNWKRLLVDIRPRNHSLSALLSNCQVMKIEGSTITCATAYEFYREKLADPANRLTVEDVFSSILKSKIRIDIVTDKSLAPKPAEENADENSKEGEQSSLLSSALELMGGEVVA